MWMMQQKSWIIQQGICHSRLLLGFFFALQGLVRTKTAHLEIENFPEPLPPVAFCQWLLTEASDCCWLHYCRSLWLAVMGSQVLLEAGTKAQEFEPWPDFI